jgi:hypothetical protein
METNLQDADDYFDPLVEEHFELDYAAIFASITPEERAAHDADLAKFVAEQAKPGTFDDSYKLPDGSSIRAADLRAEHIEPIIHALPADDLVTRFTLFFMERPLEQGLSYDDAMLARWVVMERKTRATENANAAKLAAFKPRPPLPPDGIDYRAELESMSERERAGAKGLLAKLVDELCFEIAPGDCYILRRFVTLEHLDGIEALNPDLGAYFDHIRPRMKAGLSYPEAVVSLALKNTREGIARGELQ